MSPSDHENPPPTEFLITRSTESESRRTSSDRVATHLVSRGVSRLENLCIVAIVSVFALWFCVNWALGSLDEEFRSAGQWLPPVAAVAASVLVLATARGWRLSPTKAVRLGLVYEVVMSFAITCGSQLGAFEGVSAHEITVDGTGLGYVVPWTLLFTVLVPARPREALVALVASLSAVPLVYLAQARSGAAPSLEASQFLPIFVVPYLAAAAWAYVAARMVHQLGVEVRHAHELGSYRLEALLGRGGMGEVWRASHRKLARPAAVKLIRRDALGGDGNLSAVAIARFEREAQVIASLQSPHTIELYDFGTTDDGTLYYAMELLDGIDLAELVRRFGALSPARVVHLLLQVCASLAEAHRRGVMHRDIKPANIYLCRRGIEHDVIKVLDFGLVKHLPTIEGPTTATLTRADVVAGTPHYMAPEVALGRTDVDGRADLYALGCVAFWLLTGRVVFEAETPTAAIVAHVQGTPSPPSAVSEFDVPEALDRIVLDCLAKDPAARPQTSEGLASRLAAVQLVDQWTEESAARWWEMHGPSAPMQPAGSRK